jgi:hypothetical protein
MGDADRTFYCFPISIAGMILGSLAWVKLGGAGKDLTRIFDTSRRSGEVVRSPRRTWLGLGLTVLSLILFVACSFGEEVLPKPMNILIFMGLMMGFVLGIYIALPTLVEEGEPEPIPEDGGLSRSWINRVAGSPVAWAAVYLSAAILMAVLYFVYPSP